MDKNYDPKQIEGHWYQTWESQSYFKPTSNSDSTFCIMIPPPNVTGHLHMGHAFSDTLMDVLIRYQRMLGHNTLWQMGMDHAGIATQMVVERQLKQQNISRHELGRSAFIDAVWQWKHSSTSAISQQLRRLGASVDWSRERFTMDEGFSKAVQEVFIRLYQEKLIYRRQTLVNWDPKLKTAISDLEVIATEEAGHLWHIRYPLVTPEPNHPPYVVVATTRPETLLGDTAVAVHPEDARYQHLIGKQLQLPLTQRTIPVIADDYVDPTFGSGCVKITPAHDFNDYAVGQRHDLPCINIFTTEAKINENAPACYQNLDRYKAREQIIVDLEAQQLLEKIENHQLKVPRGDRSGVVIEPYLTQQWFVKVGPLAEPAIAAVRQGEIKFVPKNWENTFFAWMENLQDWCISRQLWWGHQIPAWYDTDGNIYVGHNEAEVRANHQIDSDQPLIQEEDVLDTWFSSALWTFVTLGWPEATKELNLFHPTDVLVTGFDIIFFWVARMIMMTLKFTGQIPFKTVYVHGLIRDAEGQKMSKSKGNVLDPLDLIDGIDLTSLIEKRTSALMQPQLSKKIEQSTKRQFPDGIPAYGTDALRFTFCSLASTGRDVRFEQGRLLGYRNFCNKLWNAARFVILNNFQDNNVINQFSLTFPKTENLELSDRWIISELHQTSNSIHQALQLFRFDHAAQHIYEFVWHKYCDWYLECAKPRLQGSQTNNTVRHVLLVTLEQVLRLAHPFIPFITEALWQELKAHLSLQGETIMQQDFPTSKEICLDKNALADMSWIQDLVISVRTIRAEMNLAPGQSLDLFLKNGSDKDHHRFQQHQQLICHLAKLKQIHWFTKKSPVIPSPYATQVINELELLVPLADFIDVNSEIQRLQKQIKKLEQNLSRITGKLNNQNFIAKAPKEVVAKEREKAQTMEGALGKLQQQLAMLESSS